MREETIARNYAEALFVVGERDGNTERYADVLEALAGAIETDETIRLALESPRVPKSTKGDILARAVEGRSSEAFARFLRAVVKRGRQNLFPAISREFAGLVDIKFNRVHAGVTVVRMPDEALQQLIRETLSAALGKDVIPHYREDAAILGGVLIRVGDRIMDGSVRRRLARLRRQMLGG